MRLRPKDGPRRNGGTRSRVVSERSARRAIPSGRKHSGTRESAALRGATWKRVPWSVFEDGGSIQPSVRRIDDGTECSAGPREGEPTARRFCGSRVDGSGRPLLGVIRPARSSATLQRALLARQCSGLDVARKRRRVLEVSFASRSLRVLAARTVKGTKGLSRLAAFVVPGAILGWRGPSSTGEGVFALLCARSANAGSAPPQFAARQRVSRESDARERDRASECVVAEVVGHQSDPEKRESTPRHVQKRVRDGPCGRGSSKRSFVAGGSRKRRTRAKG